MKTLKFKAPNGATVEYQSYQKALVANGLYTSPSSAATALAKLKSAGFEPLDAEPEPETQAPPAVAEPETTQPKNPAPEKAEPKPVQGIKPKVSGAAFSAQPAEPEKPQTKPAAQLPEPELKPAAEPAAPNAEAEKLAAIKQLLFGDQPQQPGADPEVVADLLERVERMEADQEKLNRLLSNLAGVLAVFYPEVCQSNESETD